MMHHVPPTPYADGEVSVADTAERLGSSIGVIYDWIKTEKLAARRGPGNWLCIPLDRTDRYRKPLPHKRIRLPESNFSADPQLNLGYMSVPEGLNVGEVAQPTLNRKTRASDAYSMTSCLRANGPRYGLSTLSNVVDVAASAALNGAPGLA
ncbi:MAG: hypothetical protein J2P17_19170 [Mycobacterium sp.]|nr:hypothetical protein [Mycobacterium sp.]